MCDDAIIYEVSCLTLGILNRLFLFGGLRNDLDLLAVEHADLQRVGVEHFEREREVFPLVWVRYEESFSGTEVLFNSRAKILKMNAGSANSIY